MRQLSTPLINSSTGRPYDAILIDEAQVCVHLLYCLPMCAMNLSGLPASHGLLLYAITTSEGKLTPTQTLQSTRLCPQDLNPVTLSLLMAQPCTKILVGDPYQVRVSVSRVWRTRTCVTCDE